MIGPRLARGLGYLATGSADAAAAFVRQVAEDRYLWLTQRPPVPQPEGGRMVRITTLAGSGRTIDPKRLGDVRAATSAFLEEGGGIVVLDCLEYLVLHNGPERVARLLADVHDDITLRGGTLVVFVGSPTANPRLVAWLAREFDPLPSPASASFTEDDALAT